ncbi:MAG: hypothetical protein KC416_13480, partial [Myxococcales bacterium]|nr:hypothetical protein [Myxococcales bacterium]
MRCLRAAMGLLLLAAAPATAAQAGDLPAIEGRIRETSHRIETREARSAQADAELAGLSGLQESARARLIDKTRALYRVSRAGYFPLAGGFMAMLSHLARLDRMRRLVLAEMDGLRRLTVQGYALKEEVGRLAGEIARDRAQLSALVEQRAATAATEESDAGFESTLAGTAARQIPHSGVIHTEHGTLRIHDEEDDQGSDGDDFTARRGRLSLPLSGTRGLRE